MYKKLTSLLDKSIFFFYYYDINTTHNYINIFTAVYVQVREKDNAHVRYRQKMHLKHKHTIIRRGSKIFLNS